MFKLRKRIKLSIGFIMLVGVVWGQGLTGYGVKVGMNLANVRSDTLDTYGINTKTRHGFTVGGSATFDVGLPVFFQPEVLYSTRGCIWNWEIDLFGTTFVAGSAVLNYIDINPFIVYPINGNTRVFAGPSLGLLISGKINATADGQEVAEDIAIKDINRMDMGIIVGGGYTLSQPFGGLEVEARYSHGLKNVYSLTQKNAETGKFEPLLDINDVSNNVIQIIVGYSF